MWEIAVHLAVAGGVFVLSFFPRDVLDKILDLIESVSEGFPTYSQRKLNSPPSLLYKRKTEYLNVTDRAAVYISIF